VLLAIFMTAAPRWSHKQPDRLCSREHLEAAAHSTMIALS
jgi:hypothetical protein